LGFGPLRTARGVIWTFGQTYARFGRYTLLSVVRTYERVDHRTYALQTVHADVHGTTRRTLLFKYPLDNTWTYEVAIEPLVQEPPNARPLAGHTLLFLAYK
jgi:hypothetical protein